MLDKYNLEHKGVVCRTVDWEADEFTLEYIGRTYIFKPIRYISQSADTDHIRCVINQFLEKYDEVSDEEVDAHSCSAHADADGVCQWCGAVIHGSIADHELHGY